MPAGSEGPTSLPHTWRPLGVRLAVVFFGVLLVAVCAAAWLGFSQDVRDRFTLFQRGTILALGGMYAAVGWGLARCRVVAETDRLVVVNGFRQHEWTWPEVIAVRMPRGAPWASLDLADGTSTPVMALQATDGERALRGVRQLRELLDHRP